MCVSFSFLLKLLVVSANPSFHHNFTFQLGSSTITPSKTTRNLGVVIDDKLNFTDHNTKTCRSCRFAVYNIKKIRPFLSEHATQLLVQALVLSRLDYCNALLAGLPASSIKPLQLIQNVLYKKKRKERKPSYVYCVRLTRTCNITCVLLLFFGFDCFYNVLICKSLWIKASAK